MHETLTKLGLCKTSCSLDVWSTSTHRSRRSLCPIKSRDRSAREGTSCCCRSLQVARQRSGAAAPVFAMHNRQLLLHQATHSVAAFSRYCKQQMWRLGHSRLILRSAVNSDAIPRGWSVAPPICSSAVLSVFYAAHAAEPTVDPIRKCPGPTCCEKAAASASPA